MDFFPLRNPSEKDEVPQRAKDLEILYWEAMQAKPTLK